MSLTRVLSSIGVLFLVVGAVVLVLAILGVWGSIATSVTLLIIGAVAVALAWIFSRAGTNGTL